MSICVIGKGETVLVFFVFSVSVIFPVVVVVGVWSAGCVFSLVGGVFSVSDVFL